MVTYKNIKFGLYKPPINLSLEECDVCGSSQIAETQEGYVCKDCGLVLEIQRLEYHAPYEPTQVQHAVLGRTRMGFWKERRVMSNSVQVERLSKLDSIRQSEETVKQSAKVEIKRILTGLHFPQHDAEILLKKFLAIRKQLGKGTKYRSPEKLVPCVVYFYYKNNSKPIRETELLELTPLTKKEFNNFKLQLLEMWPNYQERNRQEYILQRVLALCEHFGLGMNFFHQTKKILYRFYELIKNTKDDVIVGLISSITLLCSGNEDVKVSNICNRLNIKMSTIQTQVERRIFNHFKVGGYVSLIQSKVILKRIMIKLDLLDPKLIEFESTDEQTEAEELYRLLSLGSAQPIFTLHNNDKYYSILVETRKELLVALVGKPKCSDHNELYQKEDHGKVEKIDQHKAVHIELWKFQYPTGPPLTAT